MSSFKFACPVCGQHITCDSVGSGTHMNCPTCFRKLIVPNAPASGAQNFVLTAAEVQSRPNGGQTQSATGTAPRMPHKRSVGFLVTSVVAVIVLTATVFAFLKIRDHRRKAAQSQTPALTNSLQLALASAAEGTNWTLDLSKAKLPAEPAMGSIHGFSFNLDRAVIHEGRLDLRQGPKWPPDLGLSIHLYANRSEDLAGRTVILESSRTNAPKLILRWKNEEGKVTTKEFRNGYAARIEFGGVTNKLLAGRIYVAAPDEAKSYAFGTFNAEIRKPSMTKK